MLPVDRVSMRNETGTTLGSFFVWCRFDGNYLQYVRKSANTHTCIIIYIYSFSPSALLLHFILFLPSVCTQCQPLISPCKVGVVRSSSVWILPSSQTLQNGGRGCNSLCFICQVCCSYATHFRVKAESQEMQCCDFFLTVKSVCLLQCTDSYTQMARDDFHLCASFYANSCLRTYFQHGVYLHGLCQANTCE